jgi:chemotaxis protein methyltransferase CheR
MAPDRLSRDDFLFLAALLARRTGLVLTIQTTAFAETRLRPVMRRFGFKSLGALIGELHHGSEALALAVCEAMTVNDSAFFRDAAIFNEIRDIILPELISRRLANKTLRIWCAASAAGQEAYSMAMILDDLGLAGAGWSVDLIATDLNADMIARAKAGLYSTMEIQRGLSARRLKECFAKERDQWRIRTDLRQMVSFRPFNLLDSFGWLWQVDIVLCRNVLMYLDSASRLSVLTKISDILAPDGTLLIGTSEMVVPPAGLYARTERGPGIYVKDSTPWRFRVAG